MHKPAKNRECIAIYLHYIALLCNIHYAHRNVFYVYIMWKKSKLLRYNKSRGDRDGFKKEIIRNIIKKEHYLFYSIDIYFIRLIDSRVILKDVEQNAIQICSKKNLL